MISRILAAFVLAVAIGCGSEEPPVPPVPEGQDAAAVPPAEMRRILEGLSSNHPRMQYAALKTLSEFPSVVQTYREHVERLQKEGKNEQVRRKAADLLASLEESSGP